jgi:lipooligosaccharide transport system permease protein
MRPEEPTVRHGVNEEGGAPVSVPPSLPPSASFPLRLTPSALLGSRRARRVVERNVAVYRRGWIFLVSGFFEPFFYLLSIGIGLNGLVGGVPVDGQVVSYTLFVAPGLLASSAMNGALFDSTFNVFFKLKIAKTYDAILSTPLGVGDIALGELTWSLLRGGLYSGAFLCVMAGLGYTATPWVILCYPGALLISFAFSASGMAATTYMRSWQDFDMVSLAIIPLFLFSGTFFPLSVYPGWLQLVVSCTPLYQGVALLRGLDFGHFDWAMLGHIAYLSVMGVIGLAVTARRLARLLLP